MKTVAFPGGETIAALEQGSWMTGKTGAPRVRDGGVARRRRARPACDAVTSRVPNDNDYGAKQTNYQDIGR